MVQIYTARLSDKRAIRSVLVDEWVRVVWEREGGRTWRRVTKLEGEIWMIDYL